MPPRCARAAASVAPAASRADMSALLCSFGAVRLSSTASRASARTCRHHSPSLSSSSPLSSSSRRPSAPPASSLSSYPPSASFSTTAPVASRIKRSQMRAWYKDYGQRYLPVKASVALENIENAEQLDPKTVHRPFPDNGFFQTSPVLGEDTRELVWDRVVRRGESIKAVAAELSIDMRRVAAVVRLKQVEKMWVQEGKPLAKPYAKAVLAMLPQTNYGPNDAVQPHEPINEIHVHGHTLKQLFVPVPESRQFTREDAAKALHPKLLPADKRLPIPELITLERDVITGSRSPEESFRHFRSTVDAHHKTMMEREAKKIAREHARTKLVPTTRYDFHIRDFNAEDVGKDGRSPRAVGYRYGVPFDDRRAGKVKIPTHVD